MSYCLGNVGSTVTMFAHYLKLGRRAPGLLTLLLLRRWRVSFHGTSVGGQYAGSNDQNELGYGPIVRDPRKPISLDMRDSRVPIYMWDPETIYTRDANGSSLTLWARYAGWGGPSRRRCSRRRMVWGWSSRRSTGLGLELAELCGLRSHGQVGTRLY